MNHPNWTAYAAVYDSLLEHNPAYLDLQQDFRDELRSWRLPAGQPFVDVGAGTGGFSLIAADVHRSNPILHLDRDAGMNAYAEKKALAAGLDNLRIHTSAVDEVRLEPGSIAALSCVHALFIFPDPPRALRTMYGWLAPGGRAFFCDPGRPADLGDWTRYLVGHWLRRLGVWGTVRQYWRVREVLRQNRAIRRAQLDGRYWTHSPEAFRAAVEAAGFQVERATTAFRGCSDVVVAHRPPEPAAKDEGVPR